MYEYKVVAVDIGDKEILRSLPTTKDTIVPLERTLGMEKMAADGWRLVNVGVRMGHGMLSLHWVLTFWEREKG